MTIQISPGDAHQPGRRGTLLTPRNLLIIMAAALSAFAGVPAMIPTVAAGSWLTILVFVALVAVFDRIDV